MSNHPIIPPKELVEELQDLGNLDAIALAYQAGADQELEACCEVMRVNGDYVSDGVLRAIRRPKPPPTLKERALQLLETYYTSGVMLTADQVATIRRALEAL
jgi:hypothetical protein